MEHPAGAPRVADGLARGEATPLADCAHAVVVLRLHASVAVHKVEESGVVCRAGRSSMQLLPEQAPAGTPVEHTGQYAPDECIHSKLAARQCCLRNKQHKAGKRAAETQPNE